MMVVSFSILARLITPMEMGGMAVLLMVIGASRVVACIGMPSCLLSVPQLRRGRLVDNC
jgi:O-antigen/teichoic acid export membrane protein